MLQGSFSSSAVLGKAQSVAGRMGSKGSLVHARAVENMAERHQLNIIVDVAADVAEGADADHLAEPPVDADALVCAFATRRGPASETRLALYATRPSAVFTC